MGDGRATQGSRFVRCCIIARETHHQSPLTARRARLVNGPGGSSGELLLLRRVDVVRDPTLRVQNAPRRDAIPTARIRASRRPRGARARVPGGSSGVVRGRRARRGRRRAPRIGSARRSLRQTTTAAPALDADALVASSPGLDDAIDDAIDDADDAPPNAPATRAPDPRRATTRERRASPLPRPKRAEPTTKAPDPPPPPPPTTTTAPARIPTPARRRSPHERGGDEKKKEKKEKRNP